ncbi:MAG: hypothetical protein JWM95_4016 [Gemmatimonadetes bacterium]|nr:hypothetical protein [Gemmatimonadota bacterium]
MSRLFLAFAAFTVMGLSACLSDTERARREAIAQNARSARPADSVRAFTPAKPYRHAAPPPLSRDAARRYATLESHCSAGVRLSHRGLAKDFDVRTVNTFLRDEYTEVQVTYQFTGLSQTRLSGHAECRYPPKKGSADATDVRESSNGVTQRLTNTELDCFNRGTFC